MEELLRDFAADRDYSIAWGDVSLVDEVYQELQQRKDTGEIHASLFGHLSIARSSDAEATRGMNSLIMVSVPRPAHLLSFCTESGPVETLIPPTYIKYNATSERVRDELSALFQSRFAFEPVAAPLKALAVRLGLCAYGRNNIAYIPGHGSYHQLTGFLTDMPLKPLNGCAKRRVLTTCDTCHACVDSCPTGAISKDRFVISAERCLTMLNEDSGDWPGWLAKDAHNCVVGCMKCQEVCPHNQCHLDIIRLQVAFSRESLTTIHRRHRA